METTVRSLVTILHGLFFGGFFLMAVYALGLEFCKTSFTKTPFILTEKWSHFERAYLILIVAVGWVVVISGAFVIYPWYRAVPPSGITDLSLYPQRFLISSSTTSGWHRFGMEWKEHVAWMAAICMSAVAYLLTKYRAALKDHPQIRIAILMFIVTAFISGSIAGVFGVMLNKHAPIQGGATIQLMKESQ